MGYHIFLVGRENFQICVDRGVYGGVHSAHKKKSGQTNAEVIASFSGIKKEDFVFLYLNNVGFYGLWKTTTDPFYDTTRIWTGDTKSYPYRVCFTPAVRQFAKPIALSDILDLRDKGKIWTFDLAAIGKKNHHPITAEEGKELLRLLLRNNPIFINPTPLPLPYMPAEPSSLPQQLETKRNGELRYEGYLNAWFMRAFAQGQLKNLIGDYGDYINFVPTSFNKVMDIFLTHVTNVDGVEVLHKFTCMELKAGTVTEKDLNQIVAYENWLIRKLAQGDSEMVQSILVGFRIDQSVIEYRDKRKSIEEKVIRLLEYRVDKVLQTITFTER